MTFSFVLSRFVPYKRVDIIVAAFTQLGLPLIVVGDGPEQAKIEALAGPNVTLLPPQPEEAIADYMSCCKAFVYAAEEDFGIALVEAQAAGAPVIAYSKGGALETVLPGKTGMLFNQQTTANIVTAVAEFEAGCLKTDVEHLRKNAERFSASRFRKELYQFVEQALQQFQGQNAVEY